MVRIKERYLLVNILYPPDSSKTSKYNVPDLVIQHQPTIERLTPQALLKAIRAEISLLYGDYGAGALEGNLSVKYLSLATSTIILRCSRAHHQLLWSALTFMDRVPVSGGRRCIFRVVRVSGTIRKAEEEAIRQARSLILTVKSQTGSPNNALSVGLLHEHQDDVALDIRDDDSTHDEDEDMGNDD